MSNQIDVLRDENNCVLKQVIQEHFSMGGVFSLIVYKQ